MMRALSLVVLLGTASAVSPVQKVIQLLEDMKGKITKDVTAESAAMDEYMVFCKEELREKDYAIKTATREIADLKAKIADTAATVSSAAEQIDTHSKKIAEQTRELADAKAKRAQQKEEFDAAEKVMIESVEETDMALRKTKLPSNAASLLQVGQGDQQDVIAKALKTVIPGAFARSSKRQLQSFLQSTSKATVDAEDGESDKEWLEGAPKAASFESAMGAVQDVIKEMKDKAEDQLAELRKKDMGDAQAFALLEQGINSELELTQEKLETATKLKATNEQENSQAQEDLVSTTQTKMDDQKYSSTLKMECESKSGEWETRQKSAKGELGAIDKAKEILEKGVVAFLQTGSQVVHKAADDRRGRLAVQLRSLGRKYHSFQLIELAVQAKADPFVKIRGLIQEMIDKLIKEGEEEATHEAFCNSEMKKSAEAKEEKTMQVEKHKSRIDESTATMTILQEEITVLEKEISEIDAAQKEATSIRMAEKADNTQAMSDFQQSGDAVTAAIAALREYYDNASLLQMGSGSEQPSFGGNQAEAGGNIISILEMSEEDFSKLYAETKAEETSAQKAYDKLTQENKVSRATKAMTAKGKASELKSLAVGLEQNKEDHAAATDELAAVESYIEKLKPECETKTMSYAERKQARQNEIDGLKQALSILEGTEPAF